MIQLGGSHSDLSLAPPTPAKPYPDLPLEVDDEYILPDRILSQPDGTVSLIRGFNQAIKTYLTMDPLVSIDLSYGIGTLAWQEQKSMLYQCLQQAKHSTDDLPNELKLSTGSPGGGAEAPGTDPDGGAGQQQLSADFFHEAPGYQ